ncbi:MULTISPECIES: CaiB/BaiF CoA-transferase family protein [unclassified Variovorax]|uniref:CaiB/BaiF CoA transferase family protein n=1 Tax=unclassified Variovorax TaxID=663243 RepID=UPI00076D595F|nr:MULTISPECIES: CaiB/BaiF CoA-transferase family protein [unclassified Variovorax]KWT82099.1 Alpha-methylacyl-CoA racemase [Variovorax sp. WDL1]PNG46023.1 Acetyl-CoA:oxalate CoA-transferase [Variovorax sp. B2]PNG46307.1 Acetyl-CoA:oxalate CoA-transferase [Variovorax sp. B4]VTV19123.1 Succinyl-CoA:(R)-benzylsuccinate CoA-transferase subunit BbsF [Variovorax sp. WDL1]
MGPLAGLKIVEFAGIGPGPFAAMLLADLGAEIIRIDRKEASGLGLDRPLQYDYSLRNRTTIQLDLKSPAGKDFALRLIDRADALMEGFRPQVMERLGIGPEVCLERNRRLVYGRMTGWGQSGPLAEVAGHDLNYIALTGALHAIGREGQPPAIPLNLLGDYAGGSLYLVVGMLSALLECKASGRGQVVDGAIVDGVASLSTQLHGALKAGLLNHERGTNFIDSGSHFYDVYECADGKWISIAAVEPKFYTLLLRLLEVDIDTPQYDRASWPAAKVKIAQRIRTRTRGEWTRLLEGTDVCFAPVLDLDEAPEHPHMKARGIYVEVAGELQPGPAPRFSRSAPAAPTQGVVATPQTVQELLRGWLDDEVIEQARDSNLF